MAHMLYCGTWLLIPSTRSSLWNGHTPSMRRFSLTLTKITIESTHKQPASIECVCVMLEVKSWPLRLETSRIWIEIELNRITSDVPVVANCTLMTSLLRYHDCVNPYPCVTSHVIKVQHFSRITKVFSTREWPSGGYAGRISDYSKLPNAYKNDLKYTIQW